MTSSSIPILPSELGVIKVNGAGGRNQTTQHMLRSDWLQRQQSLEEKKRRTALTSESTKPQKSSLLRESSTQSTVRGKYCQRSWYMDRAFCVCTFGSQWKRHDASTHLSCKISVICDNRKYLDFKLFMRYFFLFKGKTVQMKIMQFFFFTMHCVKVLSVVITVVYCLHF